MSFLRLFQRSLKSRQTAVPATCYAQCNNAFIEAQKVGNSTALCAADSPFQSDYAACTACVVANSGNSTTLQTYVDPEFAPFISYCAANTTSDPAQQSLISSQLSQASMISSLQAQASSLGLLTTSLSIQYSIITSIETVVVTQTPISGIAANTSSPAPSSSTAISSAPASTGSTNHAWIAGAVLGPIMVIFAAILAVFLIRRRKKKRRVAMTQEVDPEKKNGGLPEKAQLHADSLANPRQELEGEGSPEPMSELPALEPVGSELGGKNVNLIAPELR